MLPIKRIVVSGFRGIPSRLEIPFVNGQPKSLVLYGRNGTGKSSVTDAWEWFTSGKILHLAREGAEEGAYPHMNAKPGSTYVEVEFSNPELGVVRLTFDPRRMRSPKVSGNLNAVRQLVAHPCHVRHADLTRFVLLTKADRYDALATLMGFVPQMEYQKGLRRVAEKLKADLTTQRDIFKETLKRHDAHFTNAAGESLSPAALLARRCAAHDIACDGAPAALATAGAQLKQLVVADQNAKKLLAVRGLKTAIVGFSPAAGIAAKIKTLRSAVGELKASQSVDREKILRIPFLQSAETLLAKTPVTGTCPLCSQNFAGDLRQHVTQELSTLQRLEALLTRIRVAKEAVRLALVDHSAEVPVALPPNYTPPSGLADQIGEFQRAVDVWKVALSTCRDLLGFDTSALTDELIASMTEAEDTFERAYQALLAAKKSLAASIDELIAALEKDPLRKKLVDDNEFVVLGLRLIDELRISKGKGVAIRQINDRFTALVDAFVARALEDVNGRFDQISAKVTEYFGTLEKHTPGLGAPKLKLDTKQDRSVVLEVEFQGTTISPAYRYLSESQLNSFGLAVSLASATHFNRDFPFLILDDVVNSCDAYKRPQLIELLLTLDQVQVLLMTHDTFWRDLLHKRLALWNRLNFLRYELGVGPICEPGKNTYQRLEEELNGDEANAAAARLASYLEDAAQEIGEAIEIDVKFNRRGEYTLDPLLTAIRVRLEKKLGAAHPLVVDMVRITQDNAYRNWAIHCKNPVSPITAQEIGTVVANWKTFENKITCAACGDVVKADANHFRCGCGKTVFQKSTV
jgi:hypothetical protein